MIASAIQQYIHRQKLMGSAFEFVVVSDDASFARTQIQLAVNEVERLEKLLSEFIPESDIGRINFKASQEAVHISPQTIALLDRCQGISRLTNGYFDITAAPLKGLYQFENKVFKLPGFWTVKRKLKSVGHKHLLIDKKNNTVHFQKPNMRISLAGIGKGFASDCVKQLWLKNGVKNACINASGDMNVLGLNSDGKAWKVAIANPKNADEAKYILDLSDANIATSGDYEQHFICKNKRYGHNINPKTGYPVSGLSSVSVSSPSAEMSDALATALLAMGVKKGLIFANQLPKTHCLFITENDNTYTSNKMRLTMRKPSLLSMLLFCAALFFSSCASSLKPYERIYVNDPEMQMGNTVQQNHQDYVHSIREGSTAANSSKGSGGCGCK